MAKEKAAKEERGMGQRTGYIKNADGTITAAPTHGLPFARLRDREAALNAMIASHNRFLATEFAAIAGEWRHWWKELSEDIGIDEKDNWSAALDGDRVRLTRAAPQEDSSLKTDGQVKDE